MQREIRFRAWDTVEKKIRLEALEIKDIGLGEGSVIASEEVQTDHPLKWMQFTGLHDKSGRAIYEGDLLQHLPDGTEPRYPFAVVWSEDRWELQRGNGYHIMPLTPVGAYVVIGNIYENKDLFV